MPRTKRHLQREEKLASILDVAQQLFHARGYKSTTMADVAQGAGVAPNAIYWYLPSKDHLLVAVCERHHTSIRATLERGATPAGRDEMIADIVARCRAIQPLMKSAHERASESPVVAEYHRRFHDDRRHILSGFFAPSSSTPEQAELSADIIMALLEGCLAHEEFARRAEEMIQLAVRRLLRRERPDSPPPD